MNTARAYAQALWEHNADIKTRSTEGAAHAETFIQLLKRRGHYKLLPTILREFEKITESQRGRHDGTLTCASEADVSKYRAQLEHYGIDAEVALKASIKIDKNVIGGFRYEGEDVVVDGCYRKKLLNLYREITA